MSNCKLVTVGLKINSHVAIVAMVEKITIKLRLVI